MRSWRWSRPMSRSDLTALLAMSYGFIVRFLREGFVVRALVWPGLLCSVALVGTAAIYAAIGTTSVIYLSDPAWTSAFEEEDFEVRIHNTPEALLRSGDALRAVWSDGETVVLGYGLQGRATLIAESIVRDLTAAPWRIHVPALAARPDDVDRQTGMMAGIIGLLYTLYGVVMGAGALYRDRSSGFMESELALARPAWFPAASRILALAAVLAPGLAATLLVIDALLPIPNIGLWITHGGVAAAAGGTLGLYLVARSALERGFSAPLSRALMVAMALLGAGWLQPQVGRVFPICSLGAFMAGTTPSAVALILLAVVLPVIALSTSRMELT
ncbi:MAG: hypothetical protein ACI8TX_002072 [Hyphomicrobiaceae bacterium]|jgi:hypothetical protein